MYSESTVIAGGLFHIPVVIGVFYLIQKQFNKRALNFPQETEPKKSVEPKTVVKSAPISVPPSISIDARPILFAVVIVANIPPVTVPLSPVPISVPVATGNVRTALLLAECGCACSVCACALELSQ